MADTTRVTQISGEVIAVGPGTVRVTQISGEVIAVGPGTVRVTQLAVEVITVVSTAPTPGTQPIIIISM